MTRLVRLGRIVGVFVFLVPALSAAQDATLQGTVTDDTGAVLPGVTITALHEASGNTLIVVTDSRGEFRLPVRTGTYRITAELQGFAQTVRSIELLLGQQAVVNIRMAPATVQESVTVTGEAPLLDVTQSRLSGNIDPRQVSELPVNGRNWVDLTMLAPGSRANAVGETPVAVDTSNASFQLNVDGQQVSQTISGGFGQPHFSKDAIAEFEFVSNRFDAGQGRSSGVQVNAITKSGSNKFAGSYSGYFRDDAFNAADFIQRRVLPYSDQQLSGTFGGPIRRDRVHFFVNYEYERQPQTFSYATPYPTFNFDQIGTNTEHRRGGRLDFQVGQSHLAIRGANHLNAIPYDPRYTGGSAITPSSAEGVDRHSNEVQVNYTTILNPQFVNEIKSGYSGFYWIQYNYARNPAFPQFGGYGAPQIRLQGLTIGQLHTNSPGKVGQDYYSIRDDATYSLARAGTHSLKVGGEYLRFSTYLNFNSNQVGVFDATAAPIPTNIESLFPNLMDVSTWNFAALSPLVRQYTIGVGNRSDGVTRNVYGAWIQDDWTVSRRLTLNLGFRYDVHDGLLGERILLPPFATRERPLDKNNVQPRLGFAYTVDDRTVLRGGVGKYYGELTDNAALNFNANTLQAQLLVLNDGRPNFAADPFNGTIPTYEQALRSGAVRNASSVIHSNARVPYSYQSSIGVQRQLGSAASVEADFVFTGTRHDAASQNVNLTYNPATGTNYPFADRMRRAYPDWGTVSMIITEARSNYRGLQTAFTKRMSDHWQASATYSLSTLKDADLPAFSGLNPVPFTVPKDLGGEYGLAVSDQRHRAVMNGIWELPYSFQLSGLYFYGSGMRFATTAGTDRRNTGASNGRLRADGTIIPRNSFVGRPLHRFDMRLQRGFRLPGNTRMDGVLEVFNLFNHANYGAYVTAESARNFGAPSAVQNVAYFPRTMQLGFRFVF
jgi:hypothetical protein